MSSIQLPIEIINKILTYVGQLNNSIVISQYHPITHEEYYAIDFDANALWNLQSLLIMKRLYSLYNTNPIDSKSIQLYKCGKAHYEQHLRKNVTNN